MQTEVILGISGHRDILESEIDSINTEFKKYIETLNSTYPTLSVRVLTGLAVGADQIVANAVLELAKSNINIKATAVLPMSLKNYENDFVDEELASFRHIIKQFELHNYDIVELTDLPVRNECYEALGQYLINKSDVLVSIWNLQDNENKGGTADVTRLASDSNYRITQRLILENSENTKNIFNSFFHDESEIPVYVLPCNRQSFTEVKVKRIPGYLSNYSLKEISKVIPRKLEYLLINLSTVENDIKQLLKTKPTLYPPCDDHAQYNTSELIRMSDCFSTMDCLANHVQTKINRVHKFTAILTMMLASCFLVYAKLVPSLLILGCYIALFVFGYIWYKSVNPNKLKYKYALYRTTSESLRIEFFWRAKGLVDAVGQNSLASNLHTGGIKEGSIIRHYLKQASLLGKESSESEFKHTKNVLQSWLVEQIAYYKKAKTKLHNKHHVYERIVNISIFLPILALGAIIFPSIYEFTKSTHFLTINIKTWIVFLGAFIPICGAVVELHASNQSVKELLNQYEANELYLSRVVRFIKGSTSEQEVLAAYQAIGSELSREHVQWMLTTKQKELTTAHGG